jgi:hypothetical protein
MYVTNTHIQYTPIFKVSDYAVFIFVKYSIE